MNYDNIKTSLLIPVQLSRELDRISAHTDVPKAALMRQAVQAFVDQNGASVNLYRIAYATETCRAALDHIISLSAPEKRPELEASVKASMDQFHAAR